MRKLPQYYCIVVIFSQTPKFIRSLHSFLDRKQTLGYTQSPLDVLSISVTPTEDFPPKPHIIIIENFQTASSHRGPKLHNSIRNKTRPPLGGRDVEQKTMRRQTTSRISHVARGEKILHHSQQSKGLEQCLNITTLCH